MLFHRRARMPQQRVGERRKIEVFGEQLRRRHEVGDLQEPALMTHGDAQGKLWFRPAKIFGAEQVVGERLHTQIEDKFAMGTAARSAVE
jgi:hypothetical protein